MVVFLALAAGLALSAGGGGGVLAVLVPAIVLVTAYMGGIFDGVAGNGVPASPRRRPQRQHRHSRRKPRKRR